MASIFILLGAWIFTAAYGVCAICFVSRGDPLAPDECDDFGQNSWDKSLLEDDVEVKIQMNRVTELDSVPPVLGIFDDRRTVGNLYTNRSSQVPPFIQNN